MQASELRVGNYLQGQKVVQVQSILGKNSIGIGYGDPYRVNTDDEFSPCLLPITLTEEWLVKLGFKFNSDSNVYSIDNFFIYTEAYNKIIITYDCLMRSVEYVHQLQNLYFALTGEELTI